MGNARPRWIATTDQTLQMALQLLPPITLSQPKVLFRPTAPCYFSGVLALLIHDGLESRLYDLRRCLRP